MAQRGYAIVKLSFYANSFMVVPFLRQKEATPTDLEGSADATTVLEAGVVVSAVVESSADVESYGAGGLVHSAVVESAVDGVSDHSSRLAAVAHLVSATEPGTAGAQVATDDVALAFNAVTMAATMLDWGVKSGVTLGGETYLVTRSGLVRVVGGRSSAVITTPPLRFGRAVSLGDVYVDVSGRQSELQVDSDCGSVRYRLLTDFVMSSYPCRTGGLKLTRAKLTVSSSEFESMESITLYPIALTRGGRQK